VSGSLWTEPGGKHLAGRAVLKEKLRGLGFSKRRAVELVNLVLAEMSAALARGETVEFPFGYLERVKRRRKPQRGWFLNKITTTYKNPWTVEHVTDEAGQKLLDEEDRRRAEDAWRGRKTPPRRPPLGRPVITSRKKFKSKRSGSEREVAILGRQVLVVLAACCWPPYSMYKRRMVTSSCSGGSSSGKRRTLRPLQLRA